MSGHSAYTKDSPGWEVPPFSAPSPSTPEDYSNLAKGTTQTPHLPDPVALVQPLDPTAAKQDDRNGESVLELG